MKRASILVGITLFCLAFIVACSGDAERAKAVEEKPYSLYVHEDADGCQYLIVYAEEWVGNGQGVGVGITPKVNQPAKCSE